MNWGLGILLKDINTDEDREDIFIRSDDVCGGEYVCGQPEA